MRAIDFQSCPKTKAKTCECSKLESITESNETIKAICQLEHSPDDVTGFVKFKQKFGEETIIKGIVKGLTPGLHGFHIHEFGDLSDGCASAGGHYNPEGVEHGGLEHGHVGDLGNIKADNQGIARFQFKAPRVQLHDVVGRAIVVHADTDDLGQGGDEESTKTGNAGDRVACGVIRLKSSIEEDYNRKLSDKHFNRNELPQIRRQHIQDSDFKYKEGKISLEKIKPVQSQRVDGLSKKAEDVFLKNADRPFIVDRKGYLINGHHRFDAANVLGIKRVPAIIIDADIEDVMKTFAHTTSDAKTMAENYFKNLLQSKMAEDVIPMNKADPGALPKEQQARLDLNESALSEAPMDILDKYDAQQQKYFELKYRVQQACQNPRTANACNKISAELPAIENELKRLRQEIASYTARDADVDAAMQLGGEQRELDMRRAKASLKKQVVALVKKAEGIADNEFEAKNFNKVQNSIADKLNGIIGGIEEDEKISLVALGKLLDHAMKGELIDTKAMVSAKQGKIDNHVNRNLDPEVVKIFDEYFKGDIFEFIPGGTTSGNYGPAEVGLAIFGNPAKKAETHGDLEIDGVMYELKGSGFKRLKSGKLGSSIYGARLNSKGISSGTNGWGPLEKGIKKIAPKIKELNPNKDPKEAAKEPGFMRYTSSAGKQASRYNLNAKGIQFLNDEVLGPYSDKKKTTELLLGIIKGIMPGWKRVPEFEKIVSKMSNEDGTLSIQRLWSFYTGLAYESYNIEDGVENILFINSNTRSYFIINNRDEMIKAIAQGKVEVTGGISWNDDQMKASPQYAIR